MGFQKLQRLERYEEDQDQDEREDTIYLRMHVG